MTYTIRRATSADAAAVADIAVRTFVDTFAAQNRAEDMDDYLGKTYGEVHQRREIEDALSVTLLVEADGAPIGFAQLRRTEVPEGIDSDASVQIARFYIDRSWHGRGLAQALMAECDAVAQTMGAATVWLGVWEHNERAIAFYKKCGFAEMGRMDFHLGSDHQVDVVLTRGVNQR
jgi:ribosomal protein S18 acetylase RimI-like enzyme